MTAPPTTQTPIKLEITQDEQQASKYSLYSWWKDTWRGILAEFLGTLMLVLFGCMSCIPIEGIDMTIYAPFGFSFVVLFVIQIFGHISGAFINPAVALAGVIWGNTSIALGIIYIIVQCAGAVVGYGILLSLSPINMVEEKVCVSLPHAGLTDLQSVGVEAALTAALILIISSVWDPMNASKQDSVPIKIGLSIAGLGLVGGPLTGASMNPAKSLASAVWTGYWTHQWIYWVGPLAGSFIAVVLYTNVFMKKRGSLNSQLVQ